MSDHEHRWWWNEDDTTNSDVPFVCHEGCDATLDGVEALDKLNEAETLLTENAELKRRVKSAEFWSNWTYPEGATAADVQNELADFRMVMQEVSKVYDHITHGRISKPNTKAEDVIAVADEVLQGV